MNSVLDIGVCNELLEDAASFAERITADNVNEEICGLRLIAHNYAVKLHEPAVLANQYFDLVRDAAVYLFGAQHLNLHQTVFATIHHMPVDDSAVVQNV